MPVISLLNFTATDTNRLDYITLLGDKDLMVDQLLPLTTGGSSSSPTSSSSVVLESGGLSTLSASPDTHATLLSSIELINGDIGAGQSLLSVRAFFELFYQLLVKFIA